MVADTNLLVMRRIIIDTRLYGRLVDTPRLLSTSMTTKRIITDLSFPSRGRISCKVAGTTSHQATTMRGKWPGTCRLAMKWTGGPICHQGTREELTGFTDLMIRKVTEATGLWIETVTGTALQATFSRRTHLEMREYRDLTQDVTTIRLMEGVISTTHRKKEEDMWLMML